MPPPQGLREGFRVGPLESMAAMILRPPSMRPPRWNSLITLETASLVEATMFARSWCVRRGSRACPTLRARRSGRPGACSSAASRVATPLFRRISIFSSDCLRRSEKADNSFGELRWRLMASPRTGAHHGHP